MITLKMKIMSEQEIIALAREYAEEIRNGILGLFPQPLPDSMEVLIKNDQEYYGRFLRWLTRRYCLVEKSKVEEEYHEAKFTCGNVDPCSETFATSLAQKSVLERIFPDLGKEVEK